jgi:hypothetical protein
MIAVQNVSPLGSDCHFVVDLLADGQCKTYRVAVESIMVDGKTIERIVCEDGLTQLLHTHPATAQSFFRMVGTCIMVKRSNFRLIWTPVSAT